MPTTEAVNPFEYFTDTEGNPLEGGNIYVGVFGVDAQANPITIFSDDSLTTQISNPVRTTRGVPFVGGSAVKIFTGSAYSIKVTQANDVLVYSANVNPLLEGATGVAIFAAGTEEEAQTAMGGGAAGRAVFVSDTQAQVRTAAGLGDAATRNMSSDPDFAVDPTRIADRATTAAAIASLSSVPLTDTLDLEGLSQIDFTAFNSSEFWRYEYALRFSSASSATFSARVSYDGGSTFDISGTSYRYGNWNVNPPLFPNAITTNFSENASAINLYDSISPLTYGSLFMVEPNEPEPTPLYGELTQNDFGNVVNTHKINGAAKQSLLVNGIRFLLSTGTWAAGSTLRVYGYRR